MKIIGLTCHYSGNHDNSAALLIDGRVVFAESEERISRIKHDTHFPIQAIQHALNFANLEFKDIDYFASGSPPTNAFKLLTNYAQGLVYTSPLGFLHWLKNRSGYLEPPQSQPDPVLPLQKLCFVSHYLAHAETAYMFSGFDDSLVVAWDGYGLDDNGSPLCGAVYLGKNGQLQLLERLPNYASLALYYGVVTVALGFKLNDGEGKTMGLAAYGKPSLAVGAMRQIFPFWNGQRWQARVSWLEVNGVSRPQYFQNTVIFAQIKTLINQYGGEQVAYAAQQVLEEEGEKFFTALVKRYGQRRVALAGGIFLNVKFNSRLLERGIVDELFIYPNPSDGGVAVGAAVALYKQLGGRMKVDKLESTALGCDWLDRDIVQAISKFQGQISYQKLGSGLCKQVAADIAEGGVVGWFMGRGEWGPRALGQRSVLADPRNLKMRERINTYLKQRDWFMPFAPAILDDYKNKVLRHNFATPFMTLTDDIRPEFVKKIPAAIHVDHTARAQIVQKKINPAYWQVIHEFYKLTGVPVLLNTSFNKHGLPIVHSPEEAIEHLIWGCVDELAIGGYLIKRVSL